MNTPVASLPAKLLACADEVESHPHPSHCEHLHVAYKLMREAAAALASPAPSVGVGVDLENWAHHYSVSPAAMAALHGLLALQHPAAPSVEGCGCSCEPSGSDGLRCPDANGKLLCDDTAEDQS